MRVRESDLIKKIEKALGQRSYASRAVSLSIGDDAALFRPRAGYELILTCDWFLEGTHFLRDKHPPDSVGWKCLARALSDIAAMGGVPRCFLLSLAIPASHAGRWMDEFLGGLRRASRKFGCVLAGGDTTHRREILINITAIGEVRSGLAVLRSGARDGDVLCVTGRLGEADIGLQLFRKSKRRTSKSNPFLRKHLYPEPRLALGKWLAEKRLATAMIDVSDGLSSDLSRLCAASHVGALLDNVDFPVARVPAFLKKRVGNPLQSALHGGDDYELMFTVRRGTLPALPQRWAGIPIQAIGWITSGPNVVFYVPFPNESEPVILQPGGWDPFRKTR